MKQWVFKICIYYKEINIYRLDYYDKDGNHKEIHGFRTPKEAECYMKNHPEEIFGKYPLILVDSENNV